ncbi:helix-turn-helix transcriptional regulator [Actinokineospora auranticolor]|uniref:Helix-turn-helix protein n=1 Tax=Actinokineospora auranticolor TaxID=155976 RepID=A0A2S6H0C2_9PSEU|nr:helix-turn-helix transcriptional regulator [Actinokineospora auranticolor]PPK70850.1 helix-turn-helix protein [Actinokineospora auranticolor]
MSSIRYRRTTTRLRDLRVAANLHALELARRLEWSPSKVSRLETGQRPPHITDVTDYLRALGVSGYAERQVLDLLLAESAPHWWWRRGLAATPDWRDAVDLEARATTVTTYAPALVPEILRTTEYAAAVVACRHALTPGRPNNRRVGLATGRQLTLFARENVDVTVLIDEPALHRRVVSPLEQRAQLKHLRTMAETIDLRVIPFDRMHPGLVTGAFTLCAFRDEPTTVHTDGDQPAIDTPEEITEYRALTATLLAAALTRTETATLLTHLTDTDQRVLAHA